MSHQAVQASNYLPIPNHPAEKIKTCRFQNPRGKRLRHSAACSIWISISNVLCCVLFCQSYLKKFGYMQTLHRSGFESMASTTKALKRMQKQLGLNMTGELDKATLEAMKQPRCGVPDVANYQTFDGDLKWDHQDVTYR